METNNAAELISITAVIPQRDNPDSPEPTSYLVRATVKVGAKTIDTSWSGLESNGKLSNRGWETSDQWIDERLSRLIGHDAAVEFGEELLAQARVA